MEVESIRGRRRRLDEAVMLRRQEYARRVMGSDHPRVKKSPHFWVKQNPGNCTCSKTRHGAPRRDCGTCDFGDRHRVYAGRAQVRELNHLVDRGEPLDGDQVAVLTAPPPEKR